MGNRVEISLICQVSMDLVVSLEAGLAHHQYCFICDMELGLIFSVWVDEAGLGMSHQFGSAAALR